MANLYNADIIKCEDMLFQNLDTLIEYARQNPSVFIVYRDVELVKVDRDDDSGDLVIVFMMEDIDENDNDIMVERTETFPIEFADLMVLAA